MKIFKEFIIIIILSCNFVPLAQPEEDAKYYYEKGQEKFNSGDYQQAFNYYNNARSIDESFLDAWYGEGESYYMLGRYEESDELCDQVLRDFASNGSELDRFAILAGDSNIAYEKIKGVPLVNAGNEKSTPIPDGYIDGIKYYDFAIELNPDSATAWNSKGIALAELGIYANSISCFERAIAINSTLAEIHNNKGVSLDNLGNHSEALKCYDNAIKLNPLLAEAWYNKAKTLALDFNSFSQAKESYEKAIELNPALKGEQLAWIYTRLH